MDHPIRPRPLTHRQQQVLDFIRATQDAHGYAPSMREIAAHLGVTSTNGINDHLMTLERKGHLVRSPGKARALHPVGPSPGRSREGLAQLRDLVGWVRKHPSDRLADALDHVIVMYMQRYPETVQ